MNNNEMKFKAESDKRKFQRADKYIQELFNNNIISQHVFDVAHDELYYNIMDCNRIIDGLDV